MCLLFLFTQIHTRTQHTLLTHDTQKHTHTYTYTHRNLEDVAADAKDVKVLRDGDAHELSSRDVVVGDVILLEPGDKVPADGVLLLCDAGGVVEDESALTGEIDGVAKGGYDGPSGPDPFMLAGCNVTEGSGHMLVTAVGRNTQWGVIKASLQSEQAQTPLQEKVRVGLKGFSVRKKTLPCSEPAY